ncbi:MAG: glucose-1-phosphate adenylyltransferase subunit GlgD [Eubacteriales bacterium]|nr:glucose-1-phosphate adenylyltransferase subunit GlgD [Eubacteriales bacterium]
MKSAGIIFSDEHDVDLDGLLKERTFAAVPYGARYRLIDFPLSNMVNSGIRNVGIIVRKNYHSLMNHVGSGMQWDLDRKNGGLQILPPFATKDNTDTVYQNRLEGLIANRTFLNDLKEDFVLITSAGKVGSMNFAKLLDCHIRSGARISLLCAENPIVGSRFKRRYVGFDENNVIRRAEESLEKPDGMYYSLNTFVMSRDELQRIVSEAIEENKFSLRRDFFDPMIKKGEMCAFPVEETVSIINTVEDYLVSSMALLDPYVRSAIFKNHNGPVVTKIKDSPPTKYGPEACVSNALISSGAEIDGRVRNSIIFRGVHISRNADIDHCIIMQNSSVSEGASLNYAILDKNVSIGSRCRLSGYITHPFIAERNERI